MSAKVASFPFSNRKFSCCSIPFAICLFSAFIASLRFTSSAQQLPLAEKAAPPEELTKASQVLALPADRALRAIPVHVQGVVTVAERYWDGRFFVQDDSGGVFVDNVGTNQPRPGDLVDIRGVSSPGAFAPVILRPAWQKIGTAPLPPAKPISVEQLMSGVEDSQRVQISGIVRGVRKQFGLDLVDLVSGGYRFHVFAALGDSFDRQPLIGAHVRVSGTAAASFNATLRQLITVKIFAPLPEDFIIEKPGTDDPFGEPLTPLSSFAQYRKDSAPGALVHVRGTVVHQRPGRDVFLLENGRGLHAQTLETKVLKPGTIVEAAGFREFENFLPLMQDAVFREVGVSTNATKPKPVALRAVQAGLHHADFITLRGKLLERTSINVRRQNGYAQKVGLTLQASNMVFTAEVEKPADNNKTSDLPIGSLLEVSGVALTEMGEDGKVSGLQILVPASDLIAVIEKPSWLTAQRLMVGLAILLVVSVIGFIWTITLSRKNSTLEVLVHEKEQAQQELQQAHDLLEERIKERTAQLKFQITARKESELQFKAVLTERTRLAQELHDTLEQSLTGIALQLDTSSKLFNKNPEGANRHLELARNLMSQSQVEVRRSIWDLRCRALEQFDLAGALKHSARQIMEASNIQIDVIAIGRVRPLPERIEDNLLRMAQEALTNVIKHAAATKTIVELDFGARNIRLRIEDNGKGFNPDGCRTPQEGHFGLLGISERTKRLGGKLSITSSPGAGTSIRIEVPIESENELNNVAALGAHENSGPTNGDTPHNGHVGTVAVPVSARS
jgi:signal transduction histidine kinase